MLLYILLINDHKQSKFELNLAPVS